MIFSYNWLKDYVPNLVKPDKLAELLNMYSFEVEGLEKKGNDWLIDIDVLPNRGHDCLSYFGMAREISAIINENLKLLKTKKIKSKKGNINLIDLKIQCPELVSRYSAIVIQGIKINQSPKWLKQRIESVGLKSINNIVDLTNYLILETGQPFHAFDYDKIENNQMILRKSKEGEKIKTLNNKEHILDDETIVLENNGKLIDLVGIMGGKLSEVDSNTKNIILQAGNFDRKTIYKTAKKTGQKTEASNIYSQGIDPNLTMVSLERANFLIDKLGGGKVVQIIDIYPKKILPKKIILNQDYIETLLGTKISLKEIKRILNKLEFEIKGGGQIKTIVEIPTFRLDILEEEDLIEEIGRIYGYEKIEQKFPVSSLIPSKKNYKIIWENKTKDGLKELGFSEVYNYSFIGEKQKDILNYDINELIELQNPISIDYKYMRPSLIPSLLKNVKDNFKNFNQIKIFEIGKIFFLKNNEKKMLTGLIAQKNSSKEIFYELKGAIDLLLNKSGISDIYYDDYQQTPEQSKLSIWNIKKSAEIKIGSIEVGFLGEISSKILEELKIKGKVVLFDIDFEKLQKLYSEENEYQPISQFPSAVRDLAVLVPQKIRVIDVLNMINSIGGSLIKDIDLFDIYEGKEIEQGKKNFAFHIIYQSENKTLTAKEIDEIQDKIIKGIEKNFLWEVRK
ncbi:MAG: phenylalanine--tRNA ligase subunit beta [Candidatus Nealsonbacteria bacterium]